MSILASYISLVCGPLYIPILRHLLVDVVNATGRLREHGKAVYVPLALNLVAMLLFVPFSLVLTQNKVRWHALQGAYIRHQDVSVLHSG